MDLAGKYLVFWLSPNIKTFLRCGAKRLLLPNGEEMSLHEEPAYFLRWELVTTARLYDALPADVRRIG